MLLNDDMFMEMLKNKKRVVEVLLKDIGVCDKNAKAFLKLENLYLQGKEVNTEKAIKACAKSLRHSNDVNKRLLMLLLVYVSGNNYSGDTAAILNKMGRGQEAVRELFKQKMGENYNR